MVFCNKPDVCSCRSGEVVTILILIDGFLQSGDFTSYTAFKKGHNPYFNRWFSAILNSRLFN